MNSLTVRCIKFAFVFLAAGLSLGVVFAIDRASGARLRPLHVELNLWGWLTLLIYGMGYHMFPRFAGRPLAAPRLADLQSWLAIGGVALTGVGWLVLGLFGPDARPLLVVGGILQLGAAVLFALLVADILRRAK